MSSNARDTIKSTAGWEEWMNNWVGISTYTTCSGDEMTVYMCFHPDYHCFLVTSDPQEAINGFTKYPYEG